MPEPPVRILIVDDHAVVRKGLALVLGLDPAFEVVGEAGDGRMALELARQRNPDLVLLDLVMPEMDGRAAARALKQEHPGLRVLVLTGTELGEDVIELLAGGVDGYVFKEIEPDELKAAIKAVARGEAYLHPVITRRVLNRLSDPSAPGPGAELTPREREVLRWMATPRTYSQIAQALSVSEETVRSHAKRVLAKLNQPNRAQAVLAAVRAGLIDLDGDPIPG